MWQRLHSLFQRLPSLAVTKVGATEADIRYFIEGYLRRMLKSQAIYCESAAGGRVVIAVSSPSLQQEIHFLEAEVTKELEEVCHYQLSELRVIQRW